MKVVVGSKLSDKIAVSDTEQGVWYSACSGVRHGFRSGNFFIWFWTTAKSPVVEQILDESFEQVQRMPAGFSITLTNE